MRERDAPKSMRAREVVWMEGAIESTSRKINCVERRYVRVRNEVMCEKVVVGGAYPTHPGCEERRHDHDGDDDERGFGDVMGQEHEAAHGDDADECECED